MVIFSENDPFQMELLKHAQKFPNFSGYIKRLIQRDKEGGTPSPPLEEIAPFDADEFG